MIFAIGQRNKQRRRAFTLIELIVVMTLMVVVLGIVFPSLKGFFHGRVLENEAGRFVALARYGRSRAIAEGLPMELWVNAKAGTYGLQAESGYTETQNGAQTYTVDQELQISTAQPPSISTLTRSNYWTKSLTKVSTFPTIRFQPDGFIDETSPQTIYFRQGNEGMIRVVEAPNHLRYEIQTGSANKR
jgi:prepilin-type N-terminal cleavage/methylation domain-containing protein